MVIYKFNYSHSGYTDSGPDNRDWDGVKNVADFWGLQDIKQETKQRKWKQQENMTQKNADYV